MADRIARGLRATRISAKYFAKYNEEQRYISSYYAIVYDLFVFAWLLNGEWYRVEVPGDDIDPMTDDEVVESLHDAMWEDAN